LLVHIGVATVFIASVVIWRRLATQIAVDALCVTVKFTVYVVFVFVFLICHVEKAFGGMLFTVLKLGRVHTFSANVTPVSHETSTLRLTWIRIPWRLSF